MMQHNLLVAQKQAEIDAFMRDVGQVRLAFLYCGGVLVVVVLIPTGDFF